MKIWLSFVFTVKRLDILKKSAEMNGDSLRGSLTEGQYSDWLRVDGHKMGSKHQVGIGKENLNEGMGLSRTRIGGRIEVDNLNILLTLEKTREGKENQLQNNKRSQQKQAGSSSIKAKLMQKWGRRQERGVEIGWSNRARCTTN